MEKCYRFVWKLWIVPDYLGLSVALENITVEFGTYTTQTHNIQTSS